MGSEERDGVVWLVWGGPGRGRAELLAVCGMVGWGGVEWGRMGGGWVGWREGCYLKVGWGGGV